VTVGWWCCRLWERDAATETAADSTASSGPRTTNQSVTRQQATKSWSTDWWAHTVRLSVALWIFTLYNCQYYYEYSHDTRKCHLTTSDKVLKHRLMSSHGTTVSSLMNIHTVQLPVLLWIFTWYNKVLLTWYDCQQPANYEYSLFIWYHCWWWYMYC